MALCVFPRGAFWQSHRQSIKITLLHKLHFMKSHIGEKANKCNQSVLAGQYRQSSAVLHYLFLSPPRPFLGIQSWYLDIHRAQDNARNSWERTLEKRPTNTSDYNNFLSCLLTFEPNMSEYPLRQCTVEKSWKLHSTGRDKNNYFFHFVFKTSREYTEETSKKSTQSGYRDIHRARRQRLFFNSSFLSISLSLYLLLASHQDLFSEYYSQKK